LSAESIDALMNEDNDMRDDELERCDRIYYDGLDSDLAERLFASIELNKSSINP
jgi:hypothetical protein